MGPREVAAAVVVVLPFGLGLTAAASPDQGAEELLRFRDPRIVESSGLVAEEGLFFTVNDSGDRARVFTVDEEGRTVGVSTWVADPVDVEALAPLPTGRVLVGDIGDNDAERDSVTITSVPVGRGEAPGAARPYRFDYPGGPVDAETLLVDPRNGRSYVVTKSVLGGQVLATPRSTEFGRVNRLQPVGRVMALATDGAFFPDARHIVLRDYIRAIVYTFPGLEQVGVVPLPKQQQGEGIAVADDGRLVVSSEGLHAPVYAVDLPPRLATRVAGGGGDGASTEPSPSASTSASPEPVPDPPDEQPAEPAVVAPDTTSWLIGAGVMVVMVVVLLRALRPR